MADTQFETVNPLTEETVQTYTYISDDEAADIVRKSHEAHLEWRLRSLEDRAKVINAIAGELRNTKEELAELMTREVGKLLRDAKGEVELCAAICEYTAENGPKVLADQERQVPKGKGVVTHSPMGVIYGIQPWNFPAYQAIRYSIASLMAGNGVLLKHAEPCTGSGLLLRDIYEKAGLPQGLFGVLVVGTG